jgi:hypothetical protein
MPTSATAVMNKRAIRKKELRDLQTHCHKKGYVCLCACMSLSLSLCVCSRIPFLFSRNRSPEQDVEEEKGEDKRDHGRHEENAKHLLEAKHLHLLRR